MTDDDMRRVIAEVARDEALGIIQQRFPLWLMRDDVESAVLSRMVRACVALLGVEGVDVCYRAWNGYQRKKSCGGLVDNRHDDEFDRDLLAFIDAAYEAAGGAR